MKPKLFTRNFTFLILGQISSLIGNFTLKFALSMYVLEQTGSASIFAGLLSLSIIPTILLSPFGGILADRANRRNIMITLDLLSGFSVLIASFAMRSGHDIFVIGVLLLVLSILGAFESPTVQACIPQMLSEDHIVKGNAVVSQVNAIASLSTPFLGSLFYTAFGIQPIFYAATIFFFLTAFLECFIQLVYEKSHQKIKITAMIKEDFSVSIHFLCKKQPNILKLLLLASSVSLFVAGIAVVGFPYLVRTVLGLSANHYGIAEGAMGIASILGSLVVVLLSKKMRCHHLTIVLICFGFCLFPCGIAFLIPLETFTRYLILLLMFCACQLGCSVFSTYSISLIQEKTPEHLMGKVMSYVFTLSMCAQPAGQIIYGALFDYFSDHVYWVLLPSGLMICLIGMLSSRIFIKFEEPTFSIDSKKQA